MSWQDGERYPSRAQSLVVSLLLSLVSTLLFSRSGGILSHRNSLTHRFPRWSCAPSSCSLCPLSSSLQRTLPSVKLLSLKIGRIENPSCSARGHPSHDTSHLILQCPAMDCLGCLLFGNFLSPCDFWSRPLGSCPASGAPWSSAMPSSLGRGRATTTTTTAK